MKKVILVDGNNLVFRSYYATAYSGNIMKNSKGFPTNALYGFISMMNKILQEEKPEYIAVAFDIGKNFRREKYDFYKAGRMETPSELKMQMPVAKEILAAMGIKYLELEPYEADDIIGTLANMAEIDPDYDATIISSDRDLLQLISNQVDVKLLKSKDYIKYNPETFYEDYGIEPIKVIDLKALSGDASDNIPGVKGVGEKTAIKLLQEYGTLEGIYENISSISGKLKEKLMNDKDSAFMSKEIATIYKEVPLNITFEEIKYQGVNEEKLSEIYEDLEFFSLLKNFKKEEPKIINNDYKVIEKIEDIVLNDECAIYIELDNENYHDANIIGMSLTDKDNSYFIKPELIKETIELLKDKVLYTYDAKKIIVALDKIGIELPEINSDLMVAAYLLELNIKEDIAYLMLPNGYSVDFWEVNKKRKFVLDQKSISDMCLKSKFIYDLRDEYIKKLKMENMYELFANIEMPLTKVLASMEIAGIKVNRETLANMRDEIKAKLDIMTHTIYNLAGCEFNINSPKQLGEVLFEKLGLPAKKTNKSGSYKTDASTLHKLIDNHPIIEKLLDYRNLAKLYSTYLEGLDTYIKEDGKIHTIYKQTLTRTGRLSSVEPNLQNIPARQEDGRKVRKAFVPTNDLLLSMDYSQIELRILAHISGSEELINAFVNGQDIHTKVAADIHGITEAEVTKKMRSTAKAVIFGIVYGISGFGLGENLEINPKEAKQFIDKYYELYPGVKRYMDNIVKEAYEEGSVRTLFNRKRTIDELSNKNFMIRSQGERIALNTPIQGTSADIIKKAMVEVYKAFKENNIKSKMILQVHDELIFDCIEEEKDKIVEIVKNIMENTIKISVPLKVSADFGRDWYEAK